MFLPGRSLESSFSRPPQPGLWSPGPQFAVSRGRNIHIYLTTLSFQAGEANTAPRISTSSQFFTYFYPQLTPDLFCSSMFRTELIHAGGSGVHHATETALERANPTDT